MIKILIVDDSPMMLEILSHLVKSDQEFEIVGMARNGMEALEMTLSKHPHVIAMDWQMPKLDGREATRRIMEEKPTPIVIVTGALEKGDVASTFSLIESGALAIARKPPAPDHPQFKKEGAELLETLKLMAEVKVVRRTSSNFSLGNPRTPSHDLDSKLNPENKVVVIGASTGGPLALQKLLSGLPPKFAFPVLIVQHISKGFTAGFVEWLSKTSRFPLKIASQGEPILAGQGYVAPDDFHMGLDSNLCICLSDAPPLNGLKPAVSFLFKTAAELLGPNAVGILLTGMGQDGARELKMLKESGAITIAQDSISSVVHGMPGEAIRINAAVKVLSPDEIALVLKKMDQSSKILVTGNE